MSEDHYIKLTNAIGGLTKGETPLFVRNTEMEYEYLNKRQVQDIMDRNMTVYGIVGRVNEKLLEYLSFSSKYWNPELLRELYDGIYVILAHRNIEGCLETYNTNR